ncbi:signal-induced proliferation-associated 1-like protein 2 isoform X2 [Mercenaria mercenaria]|uniref:signal-induced proliferation-associated 1-like protein 2 isoform X2 n=1 Tax=Mercenaria mercenaria TaxID=6596 RepID=UPI00234E8A94|nr:signal-induced proliferation-associated 1-like protein 2 isoform X2 [Mercenaria mercenaria]
MSEELIPPFTGPMSKETAQYRAKQAVEYYHKQLKGQSKPELPKRQNRDREENITGHRDKVNGYRGQYEQKHANVDGRHSAQTHYDPPPERFVRGGQRATVHGTNSGRQWQQKYSNNDAQIVNNNTANNVVRQEHRSGSKKRYSRGLHRSNSNLEESMEYINVENLDTSMSSRREYGSTSSLDMMNASTSSDSFFQMLENLRPPNTDQRSPAPSKLKEVLRGSKVEEKNNHIFLRNLETIANGSVIHNRPMSDEVDEGSQSPRTRAKLKQKDRKLRSKSITPDVGPGVWKRFRNKNEPETGVKSSDTVPDIEVKGDDRFRRKAFVHYDSQSIGFDVNKVLKLKTSSVNFSNISTGASAASGTRESYAGEADDPDIIANTDDGDGRNNDLIHSCSFFRNEIGGEEERIIGLTQSTANKHVQTSREKIRNRSAISMKRSPECCGVTILDCSPTCVGHILPPHIKYKGHVIEYVDTGAYYYRHFFNGQDHQNYFGVDDNLGPVAVSLKREKLDERENHLGKSEAGLFQYRVILRTSELTTLRGSVLEDAIPASGRLSSSRGVPVKDLLEFLVPEVQASCLRQATAGQKTCDQLIKVDEQRIFSTYKVGILYCKTGQTTEEEMYNNEHSSPAFDEFLHCIGDKVRLKGFEKYRAQLDNKTDSTGTHSIYTTFNNSEIMFHVSTMLPFTPKNHQQLLRKRHIGNDIVTIVFQEPGAPPFTPKSVRSQFQHVFIIVRVHNPCSDKTSYSIAVSRSKDVPPFGPTIPEKAKFYKSREFAEFLLAKVINGENAAHHSEKFAAMALRTRQEYLKDLATNYVTSNSLESASKLSKFVSGKKKEKNRGKLIPDNFALGAVVWHVEVEDSGKSSPVPCFVGIAAETLVVVEEAGRDVIFTTHCGSVIGWTSQSLSLKLYYQQGECLALKPISGDMEELQEIVTRLRAVTMGCETEELSLKRNGLGQLGFHIQAEGIVTDVENYGFAYEAGLRKGSRLVEICKVATVTLTHDEMVDLLRTSATVKVVVIPPLKDGGPRGEMKSPPSRTFYLTDSPWSSSSLPRGTTNIVQSTSYHGYQDSTVSSGRGSLFEGRETVDHYGSNSRGLDDSSYGTLEDRHKRSGSRDSLDQTSLVGSKDWSEGSQPRRPPPPKDSAPWAESTGLSQTTYLTSSTENLYSSSNALSSSSSAASLRKPQPPVIDYSSVQHGNYAQELLKQSQNTKYLLSHGHDSSRKEGLTSANSSSVNLSDTSFSSGGSGQTASNMPQPGSSGDLNMYNRDRSREDLSGRRRANTASVPHSSKSHTSGVARRAELCVSPLSSEQSSPRSSNKNLSGMSSEESLSTRLRPGVTTRLSKAKATNNLQDDLMRLIDPDIAESDLAGILTSRSSSKRLSGRLVRTMSDESLHSGKGSLLFDQDIRESLFPERKQELQGSREQLRQHRLSPRALGDAAPRVPMPDSAASLDWSSLVDVATKAIEGSEDPKDRISSPVNSTTSSTSSANKSRDIKIESLYRQKNHDRPPDPPTGSNPPVWRSVVANPQQRIQELEAKVSQLEDELAQERQESAALDSEVQRLRTENARLQEESQNAAAQLRRFTEWFFTTIDRQ